MVLSSQFFPLTASERINQFTTDFQERIWVPGVLFLVDILAIELALLLGYSTRYGLSNWWPIELAPSNYAGLIIGVLLVPFIFYFVGLNPGYGLGSLERLRRRMSATCFMFVMLIVWDYTVQVGAWSRGIMLVTFAFALFLTPLIAALARSCLIRMRCWGVPVLLVGNVDRATEVANALRVEPELGFVPLGVLTEDLTTKSTGVGGLPFLGRLSEAAKYKRHVKTVILTMSDTSVSRPAELLPDLPFFRILAIPNDTIGLPSMCVSARDLGGHLAIELRQNRRIARNRIIKRIFDCVMSIPLLLLSLPIIAISALCIQLVSPGPVFFQSERTGLNGRKFLLWKLRTMCVGAEARMEEVFERDPIAREQWTSHAKIESDPRIIPVVGNFLRRTSIDELPQLWNVLRGDMSIVGPRPFVDYHLVMFSDKFRQFRTCVRPGITGLWQVLVRNDGDISTQEKLDTYYVRNWSLWMDLYILLRTFPAVLLGRGGTMRLPINLLTLDPTEGQTSGVFPEGEPNWKTINCDEERTTVVSQERLLAHCSLSVVAKSSNKFRCP